MRRKLFCFATAVLCSVTVLAGTAGAVSLKNVDPDVKTVVQSANKAELLPSSMDKQQADENITREQLCSVAVRVYASVKGVDYDTLAQKAGDRLKECPYTDTSSDDVRLAWLLGITTIDSKLFNPDREVSLQMMDTMLYRAVKQAGANIELSNNQVTEQISGCKDKKDISKWARKGVAYFLLQGIQERDEDGKVGAKDTVTCQQMAVMAYNAAKAGHNSANASSTDDVASLSTHSGQDRVSWTNCDGDSYRVYYYKSDDFSEEPIYIDLVTTAQSGTVESILPTDIAKKKGTYYWSVDAFDCDGKLLGSTSSATKLTIKNPVTYSWTPQTVGGTTVSSSDIKSAYSKGYGYAGESYQSRCNRIFGGAAYHMYSSQAEAASHQTTITVPVWKLRSDGTKYGTTATFSVHSGIASTVQQIFKEIYASSEKFPIKDVGGYNWRGDGSTSEHCLGLAIDINWDENYMCSNDGTAQTGSYWKPGEDPYSIPANGSVVKIFAKYGFTWGGTWNSKKDYMHFSYFGT